MKNKIFMGYFVFILPLLSFPTSLESKVSTLKVPNGFQVEIFIDNIEKPRGLTSDHNGNIFIGSSSHFAYLVTKDKNIYTIASNLTNPIGIAYFDNKLYISSVDKIYVVQDVAKEIENTLNIKKAYKWRMEEFVRLPNTSSKKHTGKYIKVDTQSKKLIINIGSPANSRIPEEEHEAILLGVDLETKEKIVMAYGVRNSVGFDFHPSDTYLYFSDNGRDNLGDNLPPDEINVLTKYGAHFGFPYMFGKNGEDLAFSSKAPKNIDFVPPIYELPAHVAPLGIHFYKGNMFPDEYKNKLFIAEHGSWNRTIPVGYRITTLDINPTTKVATNYKVFLAGFLDSDGSKTGRPVDIITYWDGSILFSDDFGNNIYRIHYKK
ncbi:PQQ-dependent sugar dehydrogenase [Candidatus Borreliella tachyglossi]|uniref:PQQ-dependent sugar dehydrogenase n=1 Tax=Candidatus Borreliella tachyglossi TaxID=1964448 RepID=UPI004042DEDE